MNHHRGTHHYNDTWFPHHRADWEAWIWGVSFFALLFFVAWVGA